MGNATRDRIRWSCLVFALALAVRAAVVWQLTGTTVFETLLGDALNYDQWARRIAGGEWLGDAVFAQAPGYPYFLGVVYALLGDDPLFVRALQVSIGAGSCVLLTQAGWNLVSKPVGIAAGLGLALYAPVVFSEVLLEKSVFDVAFLSTALWLISGLDAGAGRGRYLALGASIGALTLTRENALVFAAVLPPWLLLRPGAPLRVRATSAALLVAGILLVLSPVVLRNAYVAGELHLTTSSAGLNFFIGNNEAADGTYAPVVPRRGDPRVEFQDAAALAERVSGRELTPAEVSGFYFERAFRFIRAQPGAWLALLARKLALTFNKVEIADTKDQYSHQDLSSVLRITGAAFHFGVLAPLALLGGILTWPSRSRLLPLYLLLAAYTATLLIFYVFARYRITLVPILMPFAAAGVGGLPDLLRRRSTAEIGACLAGTAALAVFCHWPLLDEDYMRSVTHYNVGNELLAKGSVDAALERYQTAVELYSGNAMANNNIGVLLARRGDLEAARARYEEALRIAPGYLDPRINLARTLHELGDLAGAQETYDDVLQRGGPRADVYHELGLVYVDRGNRRRAIESLERALALDPTLEEARVDLVRARGLPANPEAPPSR